MTWPSVADAYDRLFRELTEPRIAALTHSA